jgi:hypothetical protein
MPTITAGFKGALKTMLWWCIIWFQVMMKRGLRLLVAAVLSGHSDGRRGRL